MLAIRVTGPVFHELTGDFAPEQLLQLAVLADAIGDLKTWRVSPGLLTYGPAKTAWQWIHTDGDRQYPYSFIGICESLGIDPAWLCAKIKDLLTTSQAPLPTAGELPAVDGKPAEISNPEPAPRQADRQHRAPSVEPATQIAPC